MNRSIWRSRLGFALTGASSGLLFFGCGSEQSDTITTELPSAPVNQLPRDEPSAPAAPSSPAPEAPADPAPTDGSGAAPEPAPPPPPPPAELCTGSLGFDRVFELMQEDLRSAGAGDRTFFRYVSLANRLNQGACEAELEHDRLALVKAVNSVSTQTSIARPEALGSDGALLRIDLRDLGWDEPIVVDGVAFTDKWEAIVAASEFAVEFEGGDANDVIEQTNTRLPLINADALIDVALKDNLYYELLGIAGSEDEVLAQLGIDEEAQEEEKVVIRAGTTRSRLSRQPTVAERLELENRPGFYWSRYDLADAAQGQNILVNPLDFQEDVIESIFTLPNGLNAYVMFDGAGVRITETDILFDPNEADGAVENSVSCSGCHAGGLNPIRDEVRAYAQANERDFDRDTFGEIEDSFLEQPVIDAAVRKDSEIYLAALARMGLESSTVDPVSTVYVRFDSEVTLAVAAGDLGLTPDELLGEINFLSRQVAGQFSVLRTGSLRRDAFEGLYVAALCALSVSNENRPSAAACAAVGQ